MKILIGITGSIAAIKTIELVHKIAQLGHECKIILTRGGANFVTPMSLASMGADVYTDDKINAYKTSDIMEHINLAKWADYILIVPASANTIAKLTYGFADNTLTATILASNAPKILIPAMNQQMWKATATQNNISKILQLGFMMWGPASGLQACGDIDVGRMIEVDEILDKLQKLLSSKCTMSETCQQRQEGPNMNEYNNLKGKRIVITAGGTIEPLDPVRYISNHSSGKMGYGLAKEAVYRGAEVTLIYGKTTQAIPNGLKDVIHVTTADEMLEASIQHATVTDIFIGCAAVCDYKMKIPNPQKIKKSENNLVLELIKNPDIIARIKQLYPKLFVVGFAAETENIVNYAIDKLVTKNLDMIIANDVSTGVFGYDTNKIIIIDKERNMFATEELAKEYLAKIILDKIFLYTRTDSRSMEAPSDATYR